MNEINEQLQQACTRGDLPATVQWLQRGDPSVDDQYCVGIAAYYGYKEIVNLLMKDGRVDPSANQQYALRFAATHGHVDVVDMLLQDPRVQPKTMDNFALRMAFERGHILVVHRLLQDDRVDPSCVCHESGLDAHFAIHLSLFHADPMAPLV